MASAFQSFLWLLMDQRWRELWDSVLEATVGVQGPEDSGQCCLMPLAHPQGWQHRHSTAFPGQQLDEALLGVTDLCQQKGIKTYRREASVLLFARWPRALLSGGNRSCGISHKFKGSWLSGLPTVILESDNFSQMLPFMTNLSYLTFYVAVYF